jgi:serine phosphatase RsbU (regulator of sigma subunit)
VELVHERYSVGRHNDNDITLTAQEVSRYHAEIRKKDDGWVIADLGARNPVLVNEESADELALADGDLVRLGPYLFRFTGEGGTKIRKAGDEMGTTLVDASSALPVGTIRRAGGRALEIAEGRLKSLYEISAELTKLREQDQLYQFLSGLLIQRLRATHCAIVETSGDRFDLIAASDQKGEVGESRITYSTTVVEEASKTGESILVPHVMQDDRFSGAVSVVDARISSVMCAPLVVNDKIESIIYLDRTSAGQGFAADDLDFMTAVSGLAALAVENSRLLDAERERQRITERINVAREIQEGMFPDSLPDDPRLDFAAFNTPSDQISGDWYDVVRLREGLYAATLADVTGKGVPAAMVTANLQAAFRLLTRSTDDPSACLFQLSELLVESLPFDTFATMMLAVIDAETGHIKLASAGHNHAILCNGESTDYITAQGGLPVGVIEGAEYENYEFTLEPGQTLLIYSDGVTEAMNLKHETFDEERLLEAARRSAGQHVDDILMAVREDVSVFVGTATQSDDVTMVAIQRKNPS